MYDVDAIEAINFEQLVTVTDRLLLRGGRIPKRRPSTNRIGPRLLEAAERTVVIKRPRAPMLRKQAIDTTAIVLGTAILTIALFIATLA
jgi:hypothetical protein